MGRLLRRDTVNPRDLLWATLAPVSQSMNDALPPNRLGPGETAVIAYANSHPGCVAGLDAMQARRIAETLGLTVAGTLGLLLHAKRASLVSAVRPLMDAAMVEGFRVSPELYRVTLDLADEALKLPFSSAGCLLPRVRQCGRQGALASGRSQCI